MADLIALIDARTEALGGVLDIWAVLLTVISAYVTGLHLFIARSAFIVRFTAFLVLSVAFLFLGIITISYRLQFEVLQACSGCDHPDLMEFVEIVPGFVVPAENLWYYGMYTGFGVAGLIYVLLVLMTFFTGWRIRVSG